MTMAMNSAPSYQSVGLVAPRGERDLRTRSDATPDIRSGDPALASSNAENSDVGQTHSTFQMLVDALDQINSQVAEPPAKALKEYQRYFEDVSHLMALIGPATSAGSDANHIKLDVKAVKTELERLLADYKDRSVFGPGPLAQIERMGEKWRLPVRDNGDGTGTVMFNVEPLETMLGAIADAKPGTDGKVDWLVGQYQAFNTTFTTQQQQIETENGLLTELARNGLAMYNNFREVFSGIVKSFQDICAQAAR